MPSSRALSYNQMQLHSQAFEALLKRGFAQLTVVCQHIRKRLSWQEYLAICVWAKTFHRRILPLKRLSSALTVIRLDGREIDKSSDLFVSAYLSDRHATPRVPNQQTLALNPLKCALKRLSVCCKRSQWVLHGTALMPASCKQRITSAQQEPSANAP